MELLQDATERVDSELANQPEVKARISFTIGQIYAGMWRWDKAMPHLKTALKFHRRLRGNDHVDVAAS